MVSPLGINVNSSWNALIDGNSGIIQIKDYEPYKTDSNYPDITIAPIHKDFDKKKWQIPVPIEYIEIFTLIFLKFTSNLTNSFTMAATEEAFKDAGIFIKYF